MDKLIHRGNKVNAYGKVSALCFAKPRGIDLSRASWTNRDEAVTCKRCLAKMAERATSPAPAEPR